MLSRTLLYRSFFIVIAFSITQFSTAQTCSNNLLLNAGFESGDASWELFGTSSSSSDANSGSKAWRLYGEEPAHVIQNIDVTPGATYDLDVRFKRTSSVTSVSYISMKFMSADYVPLATEFFFLPANQNSYTSASLSSMAPAGSIFLEIRAAKESKNYEVIIDDWCLRTDGSGPDPCNDDNTDPVFTFCPNNISLSGNGNGATASWSTPNAIDDCGIASLTSNISSGSFFPNGHSTVKYTATDFSGNSSTCTFTVHVSSSPNSGGADLKLALEGPSTAPSQWQEVSVDLLVTNEGSENASNIKINIPRPDGVKFVGENPFSATQGDYHYFNNSDYIWRVGNLSAGNTARLTLNYFTVEPGAYGVYAQVTSMNENDEDSTPGNGTCCTSTEDDEAYLQLGNGTPPPPPGGGVDLNLKWTSAPSSFEKWDPFPVTLRLKNEGDESASDIEVAFDLPEGCKFVGNFEYQSDFGEYDIYDGIWMLDNLAEGASATITFNIYPRTSEELDFFAQVYHLDGTDEDSTPGNGTCCNDAEDDEAYFGLQSSQLRRANSFETLNFGIQLKSVHPNPTTDIVFVDIMSHEAGEYHLVVVNQYGQIVAQKSVTLSEGYSREEVDLTALPEGIYAIQFQDQFRVAAVKVVRSLR